MVPTVARSRSLLSAGTALAALALASLSCATPLSPNQRQQLETKVYPASYERSFAATRDAFFNKGYAIEESDFEGGVLSASQEILAKNPKTVLTTSILVPPAGDFYMGRYAWGIFDLVLWPWSIAWAAPSNYLIARGDWKKVRGTASFESLKEEATRVRIALTGVTRDVEKYPALIRELQEEIERQLFIKEGATIGGEPL